MGMFTEQIERGAAFLDEHRPGWRDAVDVERLEMSRCTTCVLGQLSGNQDESGGPWSEVCLRFGIGEDTDQDYLLGFNLDPCEDLATRSWAQLTSEWREYIRETRSVKS